MKVFHEFVRRVAHDPSSNPVPPEGGFHVVFDHNVHLASVSFEVGWVLGIGVCRVAVNFNVPTCHRNGESGKGRYKVVKGATNAEQVDLRQEI
jgi:hypothetical protein